MRLLPILTSTLLQNNRMNTRLFSSITNLDKPACVTCKFYKPEDYSPFDSTSSKCYLYGNKNFWQQLKTQQRNEHLSRC